MSQVPGMLHQASAAFEAGNSDQAAQEISSLDQRETTGKTRPSPGVLGKLANGHVDLGRKYHALELNPNNVEAYVNLGLLHQKAGNLTEAVQTWERALQLNSKHPLARICLTQAAASGTSVE